MVACGVAAFAPCTAAQSIEDRYFSSNGVRLRYIDEGKGEAIVLVHGRIGGLQPFVDIGLVTNLARDHRVIALDLRGHGKSDKPGDPAAYPGQLTQDIVRLLDHLGIRRAHMVGYSVGGALVAKLLTEQPDRVVTATIGASPGHRLSRWKPETGRAVGDDTSGFESYYRGGHRDTYFADAQFAVTKVPVLGS
jgi:pimeloyl-ACP methyl ester carboxylesterase